MLDNIKILEKWKSVLDYVSDDCPPLSITNRLGCAKAMEDAEIKISNLCSWGNLSHIAKRVVPIIRKTYPFHIFERGYYSPTKGQSFHGETFQAFKILNANHKQSKYEAIPFEKKYYEDDMRSASDSCDPPARYPFDF